VQTSGPEVTHEVRGGSVLVDLIGSSAKPVSGMTMWWVAWRPALRPQRPRA